MMAEAADHLSSYYTYRMIEGSDEVKRKSRESLGNAVAPIVASVADEMIRAGIQTWNEYEEAVRNNSQGSDSGVEVSQGPDEQEDKQPL